MNAVPSIVKGQSLEEVDETTAHIFVVADQRSEDDVLSTAQLWVGAGVLEPALWVPLSWLPAQANEITDPDAWIFGRGQEPEARRISLLEVLSREPHTSIIVTVLNSVGAGHADEVSTRINTLLETLIYALPSPRTLDEKQVPGTRLRVINLLYLPGGKPVGGIKDHVFQSGYVPVETFIVNPEDRPTPESVDVIPSRESERWAPFVVSTAVTVAGCWSSLASPLVKPDEIWVDGNVRVLRSFARVVLVHPLLAETAESTRQLLLGNTCAASAPGVQVDSPKLAIMGSQLLRARMEMYVDHLIAKSGLGYQPIVAFDPPSRRKRGLIESIRDFGSFSADKLAALPRWIFQMRLAAFNQDATRVIYGERAEIDIDVRRDLNRGVDDPELVDAWDFVAQEHDRVQQILDAPTDPPEESDDPTPWMLLDQGIALFAEGRGNEFEEMQTENGIPYVAERLDDVIPPPDDEFVVDEECDELLGGDGSGQQVSWLDIEGATRLDGLLQRLAAAKRRRVHELRQGYLETEDDFFSTLEGFVAARFAHEDLIAQTRREERIAAVDSVFPREEDKDTAAQSDPPAPSPTVEPDEDDELQEVSLKPAIDAASRRVLVWHPHGFEQLVEHETESPSEPEARASDAVSSISAISGYPEIRPHEAEAPVDPFASPLDDHIAMPADLDRLRETLNETAETAQRAQRLRGALNDIAADEARRVKEAEHELKVLERTHGELARWIERRSSSLVGLVLRKVRQTSLDMDSLVFQVMKSAGESAPEYGERSLELQRRFVASILKGVGITALVFAIAIVVNRLVANQQWIPGFSGIPWWWFVIALVVVLLLVFLIPLIKYFQGWTRERLRAEDMHAHLKYQSALVSHVKTERLRLAQLHMQVPQRIRALSCWWHFWNADDEGQLIKSLPSVPGCEQLPFHLRWASSNWTHSQAFKQMQDALVSQMATPGYRSRFITRASDEWAGASGRRVPVTIESLARLRSSDALTIVEDWRNNSVARAVATEGLEKEIARLAQEMSQASLVSAPHVDVLNPDPLLGLEIETDLLNEASLRLSPTDDFLLEIAGDAADMGNRLWAAAVGNQVFTSVFAGPRRLEERLPSSVRYVDAESAKVCSSEVAVRVDITDQVQIHKIIEWQRTEVSVDEYSADHADDGHSVVESVTQESLQTIQSPTYSQR